MDTPNEITAGFGIGGYGSDDYSMATEQDTSWEQYIHGVAKAGERVYPAGTTEGIADPNGKYATCGAPADWNPGAGCNLCYRHWDEY